MGVLYSVEPLTVEAKNILTEAEISYPEGFLGRLATPREIRVATTGLEGFIVEFNAGDDFDQVDIHSPNEADGPWTLLNMATSLSRDSRRGKDFGFRRDFSASSLRECWHLF
jgi:hypothetical protein